MNISDYTLQDLLFARDSVFEDGGNEIAVHRWLLTLMDKMAGGVLVDIAVHQMEAEEVVRLMRDELLTVLVLGIEMGENKLAQEWAKQAGTWEG